MAYMRNAPLESLISALFPKPDEYWHLYESGPDTNALADSAMVNVIQKHQETLRSQGHEHWQLDTLLHYMLTDAPHPAGKRHVAVSLHIADSNGDVAVVELAKVWMEHLVLPMACLGDIAKCEGRAYQVEESTSEYYPRMKSQVTEREQLRCAITNMIDMDYVNDLLVAGRIDEVPEGGRTTMKVAHIIPFMLNDYYAQRHSNENATQDAINTFDLLRAWTNLEPSDLTIDRIDSPANGMLITRNDRISFGKLHIYFDKDAYPDSPNKYKVVPVCKGYRLSDGMKSADVEFQARNGIELPNPYFLKIHASIAKVVFFSGAFHYYYSLEDSNPVQVDDEASSALLAYKLSSLALR